MENNNRECYIYEAEVDVSNAAIEEDFETFDTLAYADENLEGYGDVVYNPETGWYIVKKPTLALIRHFINEDYQPTF